MIDYVRALTRLQFWGQVIKLKNIGIDLLKVPETFAVNIVCAAL